MRRLSHARFAGRTPSREPCCRIQTRSLICPVALRIRYSTVWPPERTPRRCKAPGQASRIGPMTRFRCRVPARNFSPAASISATAIPLTEISSPPIAPAKPGGAASSRTAVPTVTNLRGRTEMAVFGIRRVCPFPGRARRRIRDSRNSSFAFARAFLPGFGDVAIQVLASDGSEAGVGRQDRSHDLIQVFNHRHGALWMHAGRNVHGGVQDLRAPRRAEDATSRRFGTSGGGRQRLQRGGKVDRPVVKRAAGDGSGDHSGVAEGDEVFHAGDAAAGDDGMVTARARASVASMFGPCMAPSRSMSV